MGFKIAEAFVEIKADSTGLREEIDKYVKEAVRGQEIKIGVKANTSSLGGLMSNLAPFILPAVQSVGQLTGALGLVPAGIALAGTAVGTLKVGMSGFSDAVKKGGDDLKALSPSAQVAATALRNLGPAWNNLHLDVQQRLFQGVGKDIQRVGAVDLPVLRRGMDSMAGSLNQGVHYFAQWATSSKTVADFHTIMNNSAVSTQNLMRALQPVLSIFRDVATVGSNFLPQLTSGLASAAQRAADFVSHARETGKLHEWIQTGIDAVHKLLTVFGDVIQIIVKISQAPPLFGFDFLSSLSSVTGFILKLVTTFPQLIPLIGTAIVAWKAWTIAQLAFNVAMDANPIVLVISLIAGLVAAVIVATGHSKAFMDAVIALGTAIMNAVMPVLKTLWDQIRTQLIPAFEAFVVAMGPIVDFCVRMLGPVVKQIWDAIVSTIKGATTIITGVLQAFTGLMTGNWTQFWAGIQNILRGAWQIIQGVISAALNAVLSLFGTSTSQISANWNNFWNSVHTTAVNLWNNVNNFLTGALNNFKGFWSGVWNGVVGDFNSILGRITGIASGIWNMVTGAFRSGVNSVVNLINGLVDDVDKVLGFLHIALLPRVPLLAAGGVLALAGGGTVGAGFTTNGPMAIVGEGNPNHPEYVIPTDPAHRGNALALYQALGAQLMASGGILSTVEGWVSDSVIGSAVDKLVNIIPAGMFHNIAAGVGHQIVDAVKGMITKAQQAFSAPFTGSGAVKDWIEQAIKLTGTPESWAGPLSVLIGRESGGNPNAINRTDSNAAAGHPSQGLMQTIPSTFNAYHQPGTSWNITDPVANIAAGINYIKARYGSIFNVQQANPNLPPKGYDAGGLLPTGLSMVRNGTGRPERVLNATQTAKLDQLLAGRGGGQSVTVNVTQVASSPAETGRFVALALRTVA